MGSRGVENRAKALEAALRYLPSFKASFLASWPSSYMADAVRSGGRTRFAARSSGLAPSVLH